MPPFHAAVRNTGAQGQHHQAVPLAAPVRAAHLGNPRQRVFRIDFNFRLSMKLLIQVILVGVLFWQVQALLPQLET